MRPMYFKIDKSWMQEGFKVEVANGWLAQSEQGLSMASLARKNDGLCRRVLEFRKQIREE